MLDAKSPFYHVSNNHFSRWLKARALFSISNLFVPISNDDFNNIEEVRSCLIYAIANYRKTMWRGIIASHLDEYAIFTRLGDGQTWRKSQLTHLYKKYKLIYALENVAVTILRAIVLTTDIYDEFMERNNLY